MDTSIIAQDPSTTTSVTPDEVPSWDELKSLNTALQASLEEANELVATLRGDRDILRDRLRDYTNKVAQDMRVLSDKLIEEANRRNWCDEYDEIVDALNGLFLVLSIDQRTREYEVEVVLSGTITACTTVIVTAGSREDAEQLVREDIDAYVDVSDVLTNELMNGGLDDLEIDFR